MFRKLLFVTFCLNLSYAIYYDSYYETPLTEERRSQLIAANALETCTNDIEPCNDTEGRRMDGSCNNIDHPSSGAYNTPQLRFLPPDFGEKFEPRGSKCGGTMKLSRELRQTLLKVGKAVNSYFVQFLSFYAEFCVNDYISGHDTNNYLFEKTYCCEERGKTDYMCTPNIIPADDPVHQFSGYRCMNQTRPLSYQNQGCVANNTSPERIDPSTSLLDLSQVYFFSLDIILKIRSFTGGLLKSEIINGGEFASDGNSSCMIQQAIETGCTRQVPNGLIGYNMISTLFWRQHNFIARSLSKINPRWDDDKLFYTARDINIAIYVQIMYYEFWPLLLGKENLIEKNIISNDCGYRDMYDPSVIPQVWEEYTFTSRWFHTIQEGKQELYDQNYTHVGDIHIADNTFRVHDLAIDNNYLKLLHGSHIQPTGGFDYTVDPDIADKGLGPLQAAIDICTQDIHKDGLFGFAPYVSYRDLLTNYTKRHETFDDLEDVIPKENIELLKLSYSCVQDVQLLTGAMMEKPIKGGYVPETIAIFIMEQLKLFIVSDRHWYERKDRPNGFTAEQLSEVRKMTFAGMLCTHGDDITRMQRNAFVRVNSENKMVSCTKIPIIDFSAWQDNDCE